ncbi:MAG: substrate-binding domain-containing protein [Puniceicoccales bacterium]|jgi:ABC-type phosphate transport system substrate-binding protein|nr:substrate-binding domain-containing protein [Puniceicoccales bacterium]
MRLRFSAIVLASLSLLSPALSAANLAGSDLLQGEPAKVLAPLNDSVPGGVKLILDGSLMGEKHLRSGAADGALLILPDKNKIAEIQKGEWEAIPVGYQAIVVAVNKLNKLDQIDIPTLAGIYGKLQSADIQHWSAVKGSGVDMPIYPASTRYDLGVISPLFRNRVLRDGEYKSTVTFLTGDGAAADYAISNTNAIVILSVPPSEDRVKLLAVKGPGQENAYQPTASNLYNGDYPLGIPMYFVFPKNKQATIRPLAGAIFGDAMAEALKKAGFISVPKNLRTSFVQKLDKAS